MKCIHWLSAAEKLVVDILRIFVSRQGFRNVQRRPWNQKKPREENHSPNSPVEIGACGSDAEHIEHLSLSVLWRGGIGSKFKMFPVLPWKVKPVLYTTTASKEYNYKHQPIVHHYSLPTKKGKVMSLSARCPPHAHLAKIVGMPGPCP